MSKRQVVNILKAIFYSYFIVLIISQILVFFDLVALKTEIQGYYLLHGPLGIIYDESKSLYRYSSLSSEPSYACIIVIVIYYLLNNLITKRKEKLILMSILFFMVFSFKSTIGIILILVLAISFLKLNYRQLFYILITSILLILIISIFEIGTNSILRFKKLLSLLFSFDGNFLQNLNSIDSSAYFRVAPFFYYIEKIDFLDLHFYLGYGANASQSYFSRLLFPNHPEMIFSPQFLPGFLYDYGFFGALLVVYAIFKKVARRSVFEILLILLTLLNSNFNTQLFWFVVTCLFINKAFLLKQLSHEHTH
ncbi:hypothetical protein GBO31_00170 [Aquimarina litoralis]|nr:hypothetical protein [Aquimarina litoralis]